MRRWLLALAFVAATPAFAAEGEKEKEAAEAHADFTGDSDHDGTANWLDSDSPEYMTKRLLTHAFDLAIIAGILVYFGRKPLGDALRSRAHDIRKELTDAARMRDEARQKHDEIEKRLASFEEEVRRMRAEVEAEAKVDERKLIERAREEAQRIAEGAERNIRDELVRAKVALRREAVDIAVQLAEQTLKAEVKGEDQRRLAQQFLESLNREEVNGGQ